MRDVSQERRDGIYNDFLEGMNSALDIAADMFAQFPEMYPLTPQKAAEQIRGLKIKPRGVEPKIEEDQCKTPGDQPAG